MHPIRNFEHLFLLNLAYIVFYTFSNILLLYLNLNMFYVLLITMFFLEIEFIDLLLSKISLCKICFCKDDGLNVGLWVDVTSFYMMALLDAPRLYGVSI